MELKIFKTLLSEIYILAGNTNTDSFDFVAENVFYDIPKSFTDQDIQKCLRKGIKKELGDWNYLSYTTIMQWFKVYKDSGLLTQQTENLLPETGTKTDQEKETDSIKFCLEQFEVFKNKGEIMDYGNPVYNFLDKKWILQITPERKNEFIEAARKSIISDYKKKIQKEPFQTKSLMKKIEIAGKSNSEKIISLAKRLAINDFFKNLVKMQGELSDYFE